MKKIYKYLIIISSLIILSVIIIYFSTNLLNNKKVKTDNIINLKQSDDSIISSKYTDKPFILSIDLEKQNKFNKNNRIYDSKAHSGKFSSLISGEDSYSIIMQIKAEEIGIENLNKVSLSAWLYAFPFEDILDAVYVFSIEDTNHNSIFWKGISIYGENFETNKWFKISGLHNLSDITVLPEYIIKFYIWNRNDTEILVDDFYIVFGKENERRGNSVLVDLNKTAFQHTSNFNYPPFKTCFFKKENINNLDSIFLINHNNELIGNIKPDDLIIIGNFKSNNSGMNSIITAKSGKKLELYYFNPNESRFKKLIIDTEDYPLDYFFNKKIVVGNFDENHFDEILIIDYSNKKATLNKIIITDINNSSVCLLKTIWKSTIGKISNTKIDDSNKYISGNFYGNNKYELLIINNKGNYEFLEFSENKWNQITSTINNQIDEWNSNKNNIEFITGKFLKNYKKDVLLGIWEEKINKKYNFSIYKFNYADKEFISHFPDTQKSIGLIIGLDTLKPSDKFLIGNFDNDYQEELLRYNRDWRFDLKKLELNDTTYHILENIDFAGYTKNYNPKYYEILKLYTGNFIHPNKSSILTIARNCKKNNFDGKKCDEYVNYQNLPNSIQIYSPDN
ncbi:MAG: hypothetical protein K8R58_09530 [Bacteroidales bacterium]|nr:hypothetical protein [Bacteroidales bacterium]